ncbi:uncharacterized protein LOC127722996 [Mytilus californianus]|uniref:uncharacterized protein LOC127722996 n=1 Tax=Mytilus californianus TaxID=6549 RepID=UPI0022468179|nr:uncharacterized protein LOC127722996 [Mytilus californianus]
MSCSKTESLHFYKYLCQKIGSEEVVKARRLTLISTDVESSTKLLPQISSGSKGEGLNLKGSDHDIMFIHPLYAVIESDKDFVQNLRTVFVMDTDDTSPCFTHLRLYDNYATIPYSIKQNLQQHRGENLLSNELFKSQIENIIQPVFPEMPTIFHGPCLSDIYGYIDLAFCLKADQWVSQAQPWISRSRSLWPKSEIISKIKSCGVLFVPIGNKGSINENLQWRISFSVAEKVLIFSFSHTQLLCYAMLKILLKEIVDRNEDLKGLLCSYFLKTLIFWISEETETSVWRPDNIIPCFMACLQRLLYCLEYSTLLHYFIPENNLFYLRFNSINRNTLINIFKNSYQIGVQIFSSSQTLHDYRRFPCEITRSVYEINSIMKSIKAQGDSKQLLFINMLNMFNTLLHHCKTLLSRYIFKQTIATAYRIIPFALPHIINTNNKKQYKNYKCELSQLLVGVHSDAVSGWLKLASFFYVHKKYLTSINIINYSLSKCTDESFLSKTTPKQMQKLKFIPLLKTFSFPFVTFKMLGSNSSGIPKELQSGRTILGLFAGISLNVISFAHFLNFLCCYHLQDFRSCLDCINKLSEIEIANPFISSQHLILLGIAVQLLGDRERAKHYFYLAAQRDKYNFTSAASRLCQL